MRPGPGFAKLLHRAYRRLQPLRSCRGQATVEYLVVGLALLAIIAALGLAASRLGDGLFVEHALKSASHAVTENTAGSIGDVLLY